MEKVWEHGSEKWKWRDMQGLLNNQYAASLRCILMGRQVIITSEDDVIKWCVDKRGLYSVNIGYRLLENEIEDNDQLTKLCWNKSCLPYVGTFAWLAIKGIIFMGKRLSRLGFHGPFTYLLCKEEKDTLDYLLLNYDFTNQCWRFLLHKLNWHIHLPSLVNNLFQIWILI